METSFTSKLTRPHRHFTTPTAHDINAERAAMFRGLEAVQMSEPQRLVPLRGERHYNVLKRSGLWQLARIRDFIGEVGVR